METLSLHKSIGFAQKKAQMFVYPKNKPYFCTRKSFQKANYKPKT